jgi:hypothetical protein
MLFVFRIINEPGKKGQEKTLFFHSLREQGGELGGIFY